MAFRLPKSVVIKSVSCGRYLFYKDITETKESGGGGYVRSGEEDVFSPFVKIEVEPAKKDSKFVHLRFYYSNRYWARRGDDMLIVATSTRPVECEKKSDESCTLFEPTISSDGSLSFRHVESGGRVGVSKKNDVYADDKDDSETPGAFGFSFVDWDTLVKLPKHVVFKGHNDMYLQDLNIGQLPDFIRNLYPKLQGFSSDDNTSLATNFEVITLQDGHVRIKSNLSGMFWKRSSDWICADTSEADLASPDTKFWPVKLKKDVIALRSAANNRFCGSLNYGKFNNCLNAAYSTITKEASLKVEERVLERKTFDINYRMEDARIFDEEPFVAGTGQATNNSQHQSNFTIEVSFEESVSTSFTNSDSIKTGIEVTFETGIPLIAENGIKISTEYTKQFEWGKSEEIKKAVKAALQVTVPAKTRVKVKYVGTKGKCNVPFSYTLQDKLSSDGSFVTTQRFDGIYNGVNYYNFDFTQPEEEPFEELNAIIP